MHKVLRYAQSIAVRTRPQTYCNVRALSRKVKCGCSVHCSKNKDEYKQSDCLKARNHMLLDFLHHSRKW